MALSRPEFDPEEFVEKEIEEIRGVLGNNRALIAVSGGVDSCTCAALVHLAIGDNLLCTILDDAFMREREPERVAEMLARPPLKLPIKILNVRERFLTEMRELRDAEEKRKVFRETFYRVLSETAHREGIEFLVQGTILADIVETAGGVKTQHNVLSQIGISPKEHFGFHVVEPLKTLFKGQVREVARRLGLPKEISERQPFPGPGLSVRVVGEIRRDKLESLKRATGIAEDKLTKYSPSQYFAVIMDNRDMLRSTLNSELESVSAEYFGVSPGQVEARVFEDKATGIREGKRVYGEVAAVRVVESRGHIHQSTVQDLTGLQAQIMSERRYLARLFYLIRERDQPGPYVVAVRAIQTDDFLTAKVADVPWSALHQIAEGVLKECDDVSAVYYDVTPKPPATVEME
jgi:GMP synthase (glutamine-hydrolysing)